VKPAARDKAEVAALDLAKDRFIAWKRDWHDDGAASNTKALADLRKAARAFHKALQPVLAGGGVNGTRALLLARLQERELSQHPQSYYYDRLIGALYTSIIIDDACAADVKRGAKADILARVWITIAADEWQRMIGRPPAAGRFMTALMDYPAREVPRVSVELVKAGLASWRQSRRRE
jgi:hypothetical protein